MNREILFRGKRTDNGEWVYGGLIVANGQINPGKAYILNGVSDFSYGDNGNRCRIGCFVEVAPSTICEYTGLTDRNGKKIFEGDILKWDEKEWGCPFFEIVTWNYELFEIRQREWKSFCEVVGNIFDQPELLEENNT